MAFNGLMLTNDGRTLNAKVQQGKKLHITRVALGDGVIGNGSLVNRTALISQKISLLIDAISVINQTDAAIVVTLSNENLSAGFYFREIGVFAQDPDTLQEVCYLYDAAGPDGEYIPDKNANTRVYERLKLIVTWDSATNVTFAPSGNPLYLTPDDINDSVIGTHTLWSSNKIKAEIDNGFASAIPKTQKGAAGGVAELGSDGRIPPGQLPAMNYEPKGSIDTHNTSGNPHANMGWASKAELARAMPIGVITMWSGAVAAIPVGWALCNGANGTPDLRDRFVVGAGGAYAVGNTGGAASVALTVDQMPSHAHRIYEGESGNYGTYDTNGIKRVDRWNNPPPPRAGVMENTGGNQSHENRPPYYALCFIMFKGA